MGRREPTFFFHNEGAIMANTSHTTGQGARDAVGAAADRTQATASSVADKAKDVASSAADKAKDLASSAAHTARDMASSAADKARDLASSAGRKADDAVSSVGTGMGSAADSLRSHAPQSGMLGSAASTVADAMESTGRYLEREGLSGMADDFTGMIKRNPIPAMLVAVAVGFLISRATRS